jgi:hypothetical protein
LTTQSTTDLAATNPAFTQTDEPSTETNAEASSAIQPPAATAPRTTDGLSTFVGTSFSIAYPHGWAIDAAEVSKGPYFDTTIIHPAEKLTLIRVDVSPGLKKGDAAKHARGLEALLRRQSGYGLIDLRRIAFAGHDDAVRWEFVVNQDSTPIHKVDVFFVDPHQGLFAVLTQAPEPAYPVWVRIFERVRSSLAVH